ncbi:dTDP-4-dehydrorhamnose 3,5-epimerase [Acidobacteria bacterium AB60]|nr:dTDP-4-dehydrorhamnose 3,5-epimerase [Acidobacteria bacterium AB60]
MKIVETSLPGVLLLTPTMYHDNRGAFCETWNKKRFADAGLPTEWVQDNCSYSGKNVVRGIHYQVVQPQAKLLRAAQGMVLDVAVDLRRSSPAFGRHVAVTLKAEEGQMLYIPIGFGHGFAALTENASLAYKVTDYYCPAGERTILWNDRELGIDWTVPDEIAIISDKDRNGRPLREADLFS